MDKKKVLIYDPQKYFSRFIKYKFKMNLYFDVYRNFNHFNTDSLTNYSIIIFVVYSEKELSDLKKVHKKGIPLIVCTFNEVILKKMKKVDDIFLLDTSVIRSELTRELEYYFNSCLPPTLAKIN